MSAERRRDASRGRKVVAVDTSSDQIQIQRPDGTVITVSPAFPKRRVEKRIPAKAVDSFASRIEGAKYSLFPLLEKALSGFPSLLPPEPGSIAAIKANSPYSSEKAVNLLRRHEYSVERTTVEVIDDFLEMSGTKGDVTEASRLKVAELLRPIVHELYIATTEVSPGRSK